jgi:hypothetical protein
VAWLLHFQRPSLRMAVTAFVVIEDQLQQRVVRA